MAGNSTSQCPWTPHCYHPIVVDEAVLSEVDRSDAFKDELRTKVNGFPEPDWQRHLTPAEWADYQAWTKQPSYSSPSSVAQTEAMDLRKIGMRRKYARDKYNGGNPVWCGDGPPPWLHFQE